MELGRLLITFALKVEKSNAALKASEENNRQDPNATELARCISASSPTCLLITSRRFASKLTSNHFYLAWFKKNNNYSILATSDE
nr:hypothetical transcript [Hymenolepis microstoma]